MESLKIIQNMCRVCLRQQDPGDTDDGNQFVNLNPQQTEKLKYIGDSNEIIGLYRDPLALCLKCLIKLDIVYEFVEKFNASKAKIREYIGRYTNDPYQVTDLNLEAVDTFEVTSKESDGEGGAEKFITIVKVESSSPPPYESSFLTEAPYPIGHTNGILNSAPKIGPKSKISNGIKIGFPKKHDLPHRQRDNLSSVETKCHICGKEFSTRANMLRHVREHEGRRFVCEYPNCKAFFTQKSSLQVHIARHEGHRPYECDICGKKFSQSKSLVFHIRIHTGESPFECDYCKKAFKQKSNLIRHFKSHRNQAPLRLKRFKCEKCSKLLASKQSLIRHLNRHERIDENIIHVQAFKIEKNILDY